MRCIECGRQFRNLYHCFICRKQICPYCVKKVNVKRKTLYTCTDCYTKIKNEFKEEDTIAIGNGGFRF
jgi:DNA-directed RNA polymerase subunit RPC12/RpoP